MFSFLLPFSQPPPLFRFQIKEMCRSMDEDRRQLMNEVTEQNKVVDCLTKEKTCEWPDA